ncbi:CLUMA_CG017318, isoform A [Clunio marinus]|uniref:CLUMA_CG017318, isoform A n=1 Tax=Clunio marinus TaxID=568069 RepID=A0A1J1IV96_9DIPT|nr:CLUMA_CG017318, isoform A [Clunio marinus]
MQQLTLSCLENADRQQDSSIKLRHQISAVSSSSSTTSKSISFITRDEIKFINMCNLLTASFVLCWGCQMVRTIIRIRFALLNIYVFALM